MKHVLYFLFTLPFVLAGQNKSVKYDIDFVSPDSFYLVERAVIGTKARPDTLHTHTLFADTVAYKLYVDRLGRDASRIEREYLRLKLEFDSLDSRVKKLAQLGKTRLGIEGLKGGNDKAEKTDKTADAPATDKKTGVWVLYPSKSVRAEYVTDMGRITKKALILGQDGTIIEHVVPKKKK